MKKRTRPIEDKIANVERRFARKIYIVSGDPDYEGGYTASNDVIDVMDYYKQRISDLESKLWVLKRG